MISTIIAIDETTVSSIIGDQVSNLDALYKLTNNDWPCWVIDDD